MQLVHGSNNAESMFGIHRILSDNQIRNLLDVVNPTNIFPMFSYILETIEKSGHLKLFRSYKDNLLLPLDGVQYFSSNNINCDCCSTKQHRNGKTTYYHSAVCPMLVKPGLNKVIPLEPEFITPQDGSSKQDCEINAGKRWVSRYASKYKELGLTVLGDDLYCKQPFCEILLENELDFIFVCKPESHKTLYEYVNLEAEDVNIMRKVRWNKGKKEIDTYRFVNKVPLRDGEDAMSVNWCELVTTDEDKKIIYHNSFVTNFDISENNVIFIVKDGRTRWKIENEGFNILKTKGYNLEHNFGHGKQHLSSLLFTFNLLAYLFHTVLELFDSKYKLLRKTLKKRSSFFNDIRTLTKYMYFECWGDMMIFMIKGLKLKIPKDN